MPSDSDAALAGAARRDALDIRRLPWIRPLVGAYAHDFASVAPLFAGDPASRTAWRETIGRVQRAATRRSPIAPLVRDQLERRGAPPEARAAAAMLADSTTVAIVTGQQAGAFGGPLYTLLKAATAIQLARMVTREHGVRAVPVFWVEAEDHDWEEIRTLTVLDRDYTVSTLEFRPLKGAGAQPAARLQLDDGAGEVVAALGQLLPPTEFSADVLEALRRCYAPGETMAGAFARWLDTLLGSMGLVVFESADPAAKPAVAELFAGELEHPSRTRELVRSAAIRMKEMGHAPQVEIADDHVGLFYLDDDGRHPVKQNGDELTYGRTRNSPAALAAEARQHPERFSPNVVLRPIVQDSLFPTICYVAGPSELAYQAQLGEVYRSFSVEAPLLYSRASATLLDSAAARFFDRHQVTLETFQARDESALNRLLEAQLPPAIDQILGDLVRGLEGATPRLKEVVSTIEPTLAGAVDTTVERVRDTLQTLHGKIVQACKRKDETLRRQFLRTRALVFPDGHPQERQLNVVFFVNRYGLGLGSRLVESLPLATDQHYLLTL
jgi:bacillithiol biosynthesis cysteine-adding enzyme BshC